jgi:peptidoglycan/xylan/chitin deacetylase (PgdA/CDA1 family)
MITSQSLRDAARHVALDVLHAQAKLSRQMAALKRNRIQILTLHEVLPSERMDLDRLLSDLARSHSFLSYSDALDRMWNGRIDKPYVAITFDDGFKSAVEASAILKRHGIKGCYFVCPSIVGERDPRKVKAFCVERLLTFPQEFMTWMDIENLAKDGHEIGSHSMDHAVISALPETAVVEEIGQSFEVLKRRIGSTRHFAWPFGRFRHFSERGARATFDVGFESCASAERGCHTVPLSQRSLCVRRDNVAAKWPTSHVMYFMARNARPASDGAGRWPDGWKL